MQTTTFTLKEAFRYQNFLGLLIGNASASLMNKSNAIEVTHTHKKHDVNPDAENETEVVENPDFLSNNIAIQFLNDCLKAKTDLGFAIANAKRTLDFDFDTTLETNKSRQDVCRKIKSMLAYKPRTLKEKGMAHKFNVEGNQTSYYYDIETTGAYAYNIQEAKAALRTLINEADNVSSKIDVALVNTKVEFVPPFDVNDSYDDIIAEYVAKHTKEK